MHPHNDVVRKHGGTTILSLTSPSQPCRRTPGSSTSVNGSNLVVSSSNFVLSSSSPRSNPSVVVVVSPLPSNTASYCTTQSCTGSTINGTSKPFSHALQEEGRRHDGDALARYAANVVPPCFKRSTYPFKFDPRFARLRRVDPQQLRDLFRFVEDSWLSMFQACAQLFARLLEVIFLLDTSGNMSRHFFTRFLLMTRRIFWC